MEFLVLEVDDARFGIPASDVKEVLRAVTLGAAPRRYPQMAGVLNYRGQVLGVLELACLHARTPRALTPQDHLIVLQLAAELFALRVDKAVEIMEWAEETSPSGQPPSPPAGTVAQAGQPRGDQVRPIAHPRLGVVYLLDTAELWSELHVEVPSQPTQEVEAS